MNEVAQVGGAGRLEPLEVFEHPEDAPFAATRGRFLTEPTAERKNGQLVEMDEADVAERRGDSARQVEFGGFRHRPADVEHQVDGKVAFFVEEPQQQAAEPFIRLPVDVPEVVAGRIRTMIGELEPPPAMLREPIRTVVPGEGALRDHVQVLELLEELVVESEGHGSTTGPGCLDPLWGSSLRRFELYRRSGDQETTNHSPELLTLLLDKSAKDVRLLGVQPADTCASISSTIVSVLTSSASPSKLSNRRWRSAGSAALRMSSTATNACPRTSA